MVKEKFIKVCQALYIVEEGSIRWFEVEEGLWAGNKQLTRKFKFRKGSRDGN